MLWFVEFNELREMSDGTSDGSQAETGRMPTWRMLLDGDGGTRPQTMIECRSKVWDSAAVGSHSMETVAAVYCGTAQGTAGRAPIAGTTAWMGCMQGQAWVPMVGPQLLAVSFLSKENPRRTLFDGPVRCQALQEVVWDAGYCTRPPGAS